MQFRDTYRSNKGSDLEESEKVTLRTKCSLSDSAAVSEHREVHENVNIN